MNSTDAFSNESLVLCEEIPNTLFTLFYSFKVFIFCIAFLLNLWIVAVSWGSVWIKGDFKYAFCNLAVCDACFLVCIIMKKLFSLHMFPEALLFVQRDAALLKVLMAVPYIFGCAQIGALLVAPLHRLAVFYDTVFETPSREKLLAMSVCADLFCSSPVFLSLFLPPTLYPIIRVVVVFNICLTLLVTVSVTALVVYKLLQMQNLAKQAWNNLQEQLQKRKQNLEIVILILLQTINPIILLMPIVCSFYIFGYTIRDLPKQSSLVLNVSLMSAQLNPLVDAVTTIMVIKDYRQTAIATIKRLTKQTNDQVIVLHNHIHL